MVSLSLYLLDLLLTFAPSTFLPRLGSRLGGKGGGGEQASFHIAWLLPHLGFWHQITSHEFSGSPPAGHLPPKVSLLILFFSKYLSEQMFLSC